MWLPLLILAARAQSTGDDSGGTTDERDEDAIFGGGGSPPATPPTGQEGGPPAAAAAPPAPLDPLDPLSGLNTTDAQINERLVVADEQLAIGGQIYLRMNGYHYQDEAPSELALSSPSLLDLYVDARPNDRVRAYAQWRMSYDWTVDAGDTTAYGTEVESFGFTFDQAWLKFDMAHRVYATVGQQRIKWGAGRFWNPSDFLNPQKLDPLAVFDERTGVGLVKLHLPIEPIAANLYAIAQLDGARRPEELGAALRGEFVIGPSELTMTAHLAPKEPTTNDAGEESYPDQRDWQLAADWSGGVSIFDLRVEAALPDLEDPESIQLVGGADATFQITDRDTLTIGAETFYNSSGTDDVDSYPQLLLSGGFTPLYIGQNYLGLYAYLPSPGGLDQHSFTSSVLGNLSDGSYLARMDHSVTVHNELTINEFVAWHFGETGELRYGGDIDLGIAEISVPQPRLDLGIGARLRF